MKTALWTLTAGIALTLFSHDAAANTEFALVLALPPYESKLGCLPCHVDQLGGAGTAVQPFAQTLKRYGIDGNSSMTQLQSTLEQLGDEDTDGDGIPDLEELLSGGDPNHSACGPGVEVLEYEYGCANLPAQRPRALDVSWLALMVLWAGCRRVQGAGG